MAAEPKLLHEAVGFRDTVGSTCATPPLTLSVRVKTLYHLISLLPLNRHQSGDITCRCVMAASGKTSHAEAMKEDLKAAEAVSPVQGSGGGCDSCPGIVGRLIPPVYRNELVQLFTLAGPVVRRRLLTLTCLLLFLCISLCELLTKMLLKEVPRLSVSPYVIIQV